MSFAQMLRTLRLKANMTQEELADAAGLSPRSVSDLERGINQFPRKDTARLLADALKLTGAEREAFDRAARRSPRVASGAGGVATADGSAGGQSAGIRALPRDIVSFTGRESELSWLLETADPAGPGKTVNIGGMPGVGKSALAVHAAHLLEARFPDGQIYLPLHGHQSGQHPVDPSDALASLLQTVGVGADQVPQDLESRVRLWRDQAAGKRLLIVLDDAVGHDQVRPLLPGTAGSLVLITSRKHLIALEDAQAISLDTLPPDEAAELLIRLAARQDVGQDDPAVVEITRLCGNLPLAIGMLARQLHHHPAWNTQSLAAELVAEQDRFELMQAEDLSVAAAFDLSYQNLTAAQQRGFRRLGLHPGDDIDAYAGAAITGLDLGEARRLLRSLYDYHLLTEPSHGRYRMHDLIREHARAKAAQDDPAELRASVDRLLDFYLHAAYAVAARIPRVHSREPARDLAAPAHALEFSTSGAALRWMEAERLNLTAAVEYAAGHGRPAHAIAIAAAMHGFLRGQGYWTQAITLHQAAASAARAMGDGTGEAGALTDQGHVQRMLGDYQAAMISLRRAAELSRGIGDQACEARALKHLSILQRLTWDNQSAIRSATQAIALYTEVGDRLGEASALTELGAAELAGGKHAAANASLTQAVRMCREAGNELAEASALDHLSATQGATGDYQAAISSLTRALQLWHAVGNRHGEALALEYMGAMRQASGDLDVAGQYFGQALALHQGLGSRHGQARALTKLAGLQSAAGEYDVAADDLALALDLYRRAQDHQNEAAVLNDLGDLMVTAAQRRKALPYYEQALQIASGLPAGQQEARALAGISAIGQAG